MKVKDVFMEELCKKIQKIEVLRNEDLRKITQKMYQHYAKESYLGTVEWSNRLKTSGGNIRYYPDTKQGLIRVNRRYVDKFGTMELLDVLKHELAHYYLYRQGSMRHGHKESFRSVLKQIFLSECVTAKYNEEVYHYTYTCIQCGSIHKSVRKIKRKIYCGKCAKQNKGRIDENYRMKLTSKK